MRASRSLALSVFFVSLASVGIAAQASAADAPARPLVRLLHSKAKAHPLADTSGRVAVTVALPPGADARALGLMPLAKGLGTIRLAPDAVEPFAAAHPELSLSVSPPLQPLLDVSGTWTRVAAFRSATGGTGKGVVVGVIDTGLDVAHPDFRDAEGRSRVAWMLVAGRTPLGLHPELEAEFGCSDSKQASCAILSGADIDAINTGQLDVALPGDVQGHGTHVTSIAAGNGGLMPNTTSPYVGVAPEATLVIASPSSASGFQDADILNAARFVFERAESLKMPAVLNLSVGGDFGPHDGTSALEKGLASLVGDDKPGRAIVVAAGNSGAMYKIKENGPLGIHTEVRVTPGSETRVPIMTPKSEDGKGFVWITFRPGDEVSVGLDAPGGSGWIGLVDPGDEAGYDDGKTTAAVVNKLVNDNTPITSDTNSAVVVFDGAWAEGSFAIRLSGHGDAQLWVTGQGDVSPTKSLGLLFERAVRQGTIAVPASHPSLLAVGCTLNRVAWDPLKGPPIELASVGGEDAPLPDSMCYFSSAGPTPLGVAKPEISAPGGFVAAAMAAQSDPRTMPGGMFDGPGCPTGEPCYVTDEHHAITAGSSMSAPHVAGAVALLFQLDPKLTQARVTDVLQAGARYPTGSVPNQTQLGPGALDIEGARLALAEEQGSPLTPSVDKSWFVLSSAYARPDPSWPVWGTVELRREDGSIASGIAGTDLELSVTGGIVTQPLTKVRHGLFRFAVAGERGAGGTKMIVDVRYQGQSIGESREVPIGEDAWRSKGLVDATSGGCAWPSSGATSASRSLSPFGMFAAVGLVSLGRRRRRSRGEG
ncbi:S8 family serine peptidase [Polyangium aurulentum]|uniref:S8 family serine peptidase n=1 Tax=Polyangium aurulentum TaxID=2567896 RepID=UPI001F225C4A|nr:S8 family serine peptidase [Polyangium aurulentum]